MHFKTIKKKNGLSQEKLADECRIRRLAVSIGSIKRAEAGKNILYRTAVHLAEFFSITIEDLIDEPPISLWKYLATQPIQLKPCIGRDLELSQLQKLQKLSNTGLQTACIYGMQGLGKTTLVHHFLSRSAQSNKRTLYLSAFDQDTFLRRFICITLDIPDVYDDVQLRCKIKTITKSSLVYCYLLWLSGLSLNKPESQALNSLSETRLYEVEVISVMVLIQNIKQRIISVLAIDSLQHLKKKQLRVIKIFTQNMITQPILIIFSLTDTLQFSYLPDWLDNSHRIHLKPLQPDSINALANTEMKTECLLPMDDYTHKK